MNNQQLNAGALIFFGVFILPLVFNWLTCECYKTSNRQVVQKISETGYINYEELQTLLNNNETKGFLILDVRPHHIYKEGHLHGAVNVPFTELREKQHRKTLKTSNPIIIYSDEQKLSVAAQVMLLGQGYDGVFVIPGGYESIRAFAIDNFVPARAFYNEDKAMFDYPRFMKLDPVQAERKAPGIFAIPGAEDITPVPGGC